MILWVKLINQEKIRQLASHPQKSVHIIKKLQNHHVLKALQSHMQREQQGRATVAGITEHVTLKMTKKSDNVFNQ